MAWQGKGTALYYLGRLNESIQYFDKVMELAQQAKFPPRYFYAYIHNSILKLRNSNNTCF